MRRRDDLTDAVPSGDGGRLRPKTEGYRHPRPGRRREDHADAVSSGDEERDDDRQPRRGRRRDDHAEEESSDDAETRRASSKQKRRTVKQRPKSTSSDGSGDRSDHRRHGKQLKRRKWMTPDKFDGTVPVATFLSQFITCAEYNEWDDADKLAHLRVSLKGQAALLLSTESDRCTTYAQFERKLRQRYGTEGQTTLYRTQLRTRRRGKNETLQAVYLDVSRLAALAYPGRPTEHGDAIAVDAFIEALDDVELEMRIRDREPRDLDSAYRLALMLEANARGRRDRQDVAGENTRYKIRARTVQSDSESEGFKKKVSFEQAQKNDESAARIKRLEIRVSATTEADGGAEA